MKCCCSQKKNHACIPTGTINVMNKSRQSICRNTALLVTTICICSKATSPIDTVCLYTTIVIKDNFTDLVFVSNDMKQISRVHPVCFTNSRRISMQLLQIPLMTSVVINLVLLVAGLHFFQMIHLSPRILKNGIIAIIINSNKFVHVTLNEIM